MIRNRVSECVEDILQLARGRPGVDPDHHAAEQRDREVGDQPLRAIAHQDRDLVAAADAERVKRRVRCAAPRRGAGDTYSAGRIRLALRDRGSVRELVDRSGMVRLAGIVATAALSIAPEQARDARSVGRGGDRVDLALDLRGARITEEAGERGARARRTPVASSGSRRRAAARPYGRRAASR